MTKMVAAIGTTHPWNIAGLGLDQRIAVMYGVRLLSVVAAVSAQDARGLQAVEAVSTKLLRAQLDTLPMNEVGALRIGALVGAENIRVVAGFVGAHPETPAVVDPVCSPTLGGAFVDDAALPVLKDLASLPSVILTPNLEEAARLLAVEHIDDNELGEAAQRLRERGASAVLVKGGHLAGDPVDALAFSGGVELFKDKRLPTSMRGTGCVLAMALACELARGQQLRAAVLAAREFTRKRIAAAERFAGLRTAY